MRSLLSTITLAAVVTTACAPSDQAADTAGATAAAAVATPAPLTVADVAGTWNGQTMAAESDSVLRRWTSIYGSDTSARLVIEGSRDTVMYAVQFQGDSMIATSVPYRRPGDPRSSPEVVFRSVGRLQDGRLVGTVTTMLASNRDSVIQRARFEATRAAP